MKLLSKVFLIGIMIVARPATATDEIHYIGFNKFETMDVTNSSDAFNEYIRQLTPIMSRYGMTVQSYDVVHGGSKALDADVVTFGSARNQESFQAFFQDPEFQKIFPLLIGALSEHQVIFTGRPFAITGKDNGHTLLSLSWVKGDPVKSLAKLGMLNEGISQVFDTYGVQQIAQASGVMSSRGLAEEVTQTSPPELLELWSMDDAHGFYDDPLVKAASDDVANLVLHSESFWLKPRNIR
jgi:hypothetical protein